MSFYAVSQGCEPKIAQSYYIFQKHARENAKIFDIFSFLAVLVILGGLFVLKSIIKKRHLCDVSFVWTFWRPDVAERAVFNPASFLAVFFFAGFRGYAQ